MELAKPQNSEDQEQTERKSIYSTIDYMQPQRFQNTEAKEEKMDIIQSSEMKSSAIRSIGISEVNINEELSPNIK